MTRPLPHVLEQMEMMAVAELREAARHAAATAPPAHDDPLEACLAWDMAGTLPLPGDTETTSG